MQRGIGPDLDAKVDRLWEEPEGVADLAVQVVDPLWDDLLERR